MKRSLLVAAGFALALSVSAQNNPDENKEKKEKEKTEQNAPPAEHKEDQGAQPGAQRHQHEGMPTKQHERTEANDQHAAHSKTHETKANQKAPGAQTTTETRKEGAAVRSTTVFRSGKQVSENLTLHRSTREKTSVHFSIGTHPREWWLRTYSIVLLEGCYYYLANDGCWYPAYGFDPGCTFPVGVVFCE